MISDERFDALVRRAGVLSTGVISESQRPDVDWAFVYRDILGHVISNEQRDDDLTRWSNLTATGVQMREAQKVES